MKQQKPNTVISRGRIFKYFPNDFLVENKSQLSINEYQTRFAATYAIVEINH